MNIEAVSGLFKKGVKLSKLLRKGIAPHVVLFVAALLVAMVVAQVSLPDTSAPEEEPKWTGQWNGELIGANVAYEAGYRGQGIKVAVLDTGLDFEHPDLENAVYDGKNYAHGPEVAYHDSFGHGSHVGGIVASRTTSFMGIAPEAEIYSVKVMSDYGYGYWFWVKEGIEWSIANDMDIITMSFGGAEPWTPKYIEQVMQKAASEDILLVASGGNQGDAPWNVAPASFSSVMAVGAVDWELNVPTWSARQEYIELVAPGAVILSTCTGYFRDIYAWAGFGSLTHCWISGTSMSAPHVAGAAAVLMSSPIPAPADVDEDGEWDATEVRAWLTATAYDIGPKGRDNATGYGVVDLAAALGMGYRAPADFDVPDDPTQLKAAIMVDWVSDSAGFSATARFMSEREG
jgi:subtilisin